jgi:hypothetical protein
MSPRDVARAVNIGRVGLGVALVLAPRLAAVGWLGEEAARPATGAVLRAHGSRDAVIGAIALHTLDDPKVAARCLRTAAIVDVVDLVATLAARRALPRTGVVAVSAMAAAGAGAQIWAAGRLAAGEPG